MLKQERAVKPPTGQSHATMRKLRGDAGAGSQEWPDAVGVEQDPMAVVPEENPLDDDVIVDNGTCVVKQEDMEEYQDMGNQPGPAPLPTAPNSTELTAGRIHPPKKSGKKQDLTEEAKAKKEAKAKAIEDAKAAKEAKAAAAKEAKAKAREEAKTEKQAQAKAKAEAREKAKAEAKAMKEAKEKAKEDARAKAKEEAKAKQEAKAKAREHAKAKKEAKSSSTPRKTKPNADKPEVSNGAGSSTGTQAALTATSSTTATLPDDPLITFSGMDLRGVLQQMLDALPVDVAPDGDDPLTSTSSTPTAKSSKSTKEACLPSEPADLTSSDSSALTNSEYLQKILEEFSGLPFIQPTNTEEEDDASEVAAMELINRHFEAAEGDDVLDSESLFMTPITTKKVCVDAFGVAAQEQMDVHVDASESVGIQTSGLLSMPPTITEEECVDAFGVAAQELIDVRVEASEGVGILGSGLLSMPPTITEEECYTSGDAAQELMEVHVEASEDVGIQTSGLLSMPPTITELPPTITEKECHASEVSAQELMDVHVEASEDVGIQTSGLLSMPSTINEKECVDASEVAAQELMDVHVGASEGVGIQGSGLLPMPSTITESEFYETGDIADSIMDSLISEGAGLPGSGSYPVESQVVTMVDESSSGVPMGCVMIRDTSPGTETLDSESMLLENESQGSAPARVVITGIKMAETCLESSEAMELDVDQERKRKTAKDSGESFKRHCPNPEDVDVGSFTAFFITDQRQPAPEFLKTLMELRLVETVESREVKRMRYITHLQEHRRSDIWCVELTTSGALTQKLNGILAQSNQMQELDTLNATFEPSKRIHLAKQMTQSDMALTSYLLVLQKILGTSCKVDSKMLLVEFGRTITISGCFEEYPEQATKAYQLMNRYARNQVDSVLSTETKKTVDDSVGADTLEKLREALAKLNGVEGAECVSLLKRHLTEDVFEIFKNRKTQCVKDFLECISAGLKNLNTPIGVYAVVPDAYFRFSLFFDRIISDIHGFGPGEKHPPSDLGDGSHFPPLDIEGKYILSTRIRCARSVKGFSFIPSLSKDQLHSMEGKFRKAFKENFNKEMAGKYYPLTSNIPSCAKEIFDKHLFRNDRNSNLENAGAKCHWPTGRGVFINTQRTFIAYTNVEDNIKLVATENGSDVGNALGRINQGLSALGKEMRFTWNQRLGWLTFDPANLGSTVRASVQIRLPKLAAQDDFLDICKTLHLRANREEGDENIYTLSNKKCLGITERDAVSQMYTGVQQLIQMERATD